MLCTTKLAQALPSTTLYYKACTAHLGVALGTTKLAQSTFQYYFLLQSLRKALPSTTLYHKACTKYFPVLLCTSTLAHSTSQYYLLLQSLHLAQSISQYYCVLQSSHQYFPVLYFVLQSLQEVLPSITLYYKTCTKYFPVLLCNTKLAQSTFQYYCVLQILHKTLPCTILFYEACAKYFPVLLALCIWKLAPAVLRITKFAPVLPNNTLYYCTKHVPILLCTTKLAQSTSQHYFLKGILKRNHQRQNEEHVLTNHYRSLDAATPIRFTMSSCKRQYIVLRMQPRHQATLRQPLQCSIEILNCQTQWNYAQRREKLQLQNRLSAPKEKKKLKHFRKWILRGKSPAPKWRTSADKSLSQPWCSHDLQCPAPKWQQY